MAHLSLPDPEVLKGLGEPFAAGYFEEPAASPMRRWSRAVRRRFEARSLPVFSGQLLYPSGPAVLGNDNRIVSPSYSFTWSYSDAALMDRLKEAREAEKDALLGLQTAMRDLEARLDIIRTPHVVGGRGYTHSIPHYGRVLREGLSGFQCRIEERLEWARRTHRQEAIDLTLSLLDVLAGVAQWHGRLLDRLSKSLAGDSATADTRARIFHALERVPFQPARTFFEAVVAYNFVYTMDDCDNLGRVDLELFPFYQRDLAEGRVSRQDALRLIRSLWENCEANTGWSAGIGGTTPGGEPAYNDLTLICLEAAQKIRRPNLQLHVRNDMPQPVWYAALDTIATGCGLPALYNEEEYLVSLREAHLGIRERDLGWHNGGGCTETMIHGRSNVGSLDAGINLPLILEKSLRERLSGAQTFAECLTDFKEDVAKAVREIAEQVSADQKMKALWRPQPMRTLLIDDCIDACREFNAGGARYNWSVINVAGLANVVDSMAALERVVFQTRGMTGDEFLKVLDRNYEGDEAFRRSLDRCPRFGNDDPDADRIAHEVASFVFEEFLRYAPWRGGKFLPSCLMFVTYADAGKAVPATPDGRRAGDPIADSAGPHQGRDRHGPTAMLKSVASIPHRLAPGTLVVNIRFSRELFDTRDSRRNIQNLVRAYFAMGGMQLQINVVDQSVLRDAMDHPERHEDLIVRIGGYSEYFNRLSPDLQRSVLERTEHGGR